MSALDWHILGIFRLLISISPIFIKMLMLCTKFKDHASKKFARGYYLDPSTPDTVHEYPNQALSKFTALIRLPSL